MTFFGLPLHVLLVHAVVVLVPLASIGGIAISVLKWARKRYGELVLVGAFGAAITTFIAQEAGEDFQRSPNFANPTPEMLEHFALGDDLLIWTILLFVGIAAVVLGQLLLNRHNARGNLVLVVGMVLTVVCAVMSIIQTVRIGHSGALAVWGGMAS
jgi:hypothetical protein